MRRGAVLKAVAWRRGAVLKAAHRTAMCALGTSVRSIEDSWHLSTPLGRLTSCPRVPEQQAHPGS